jgi:hypothetical protein
MTSGSGWAEVPHQLAAAVVVGWVGRFDDAGVMAVAVRSAVPDRAFASALVPDGAAAESERSEGHEPTPAAPGNPSRHKCSRLPVPPVFTQLVEERVRIVAVLVYPLPRRFLLVVASVWAWLNGVGGGILRPATSGHGRSSATSGNGRHPRVWKPRGDQLECLRAGEARRRNWNPGADCSISAP